MAKQQDLSRKAQRLNLLATQNLNSNVDDVLNMIQGKPAPSSSKGVEIDFVIVFSQSHKKNAPTTSRRSFELQLPSPIMSADRLERHAQRQLVKLLRIAGLQVPSSISNDDDLVLRLYNIVVATKTMTFGRAKCPIDRQRERHLGKRVGTPLHLEWI
jgi:hypothetical protein